MSFDTVTAYRCGHHGCRRRPVVTIRAAESHDKMCIHNAANRTCATCAHDTGADEGKCGELGKDEFFKRNCPAWEDRMDYGRDE